MKKGFTLVELLAVLVIIGIIALIAIPTVLSLIQKSKNEANQKSIELYSRAIREAVLSYEIENDVSVTGICNDIAHPQASCVNDQSKMNLSEVKYDGEKITCDSVAINLDSSIYLGKCYFESNEENKIDYGNSKILGDVDGNGILNDDDFTKLDNYIFLSSMSENFKEENADINEDGNIDELDYLILGRIIGSVFSSVTGDINEDGNVDIQDLLMLKLYLTARTIVYPANIDEYCDVNKDNRCNSQDVLLLSNLISGQEITIGKTKYSLEKKYKYCDFNLDGIVDYKDIDDIETYISDSTYNFSHAISLKAADIDVNGSLDEKDIKYIELYIKYYAVLE